MPIAQASTPAAPIHRVAHAIAPTGVSGTVRALSRQSEVSRQTIDRWGGTRTNQPGRRMWPQTRVVLRESPSPAPLR